MWDDQAADPSARLLRTGDARWWRGPDDADLTAFDGSGSLTQLDAAWQQSPAHLWASCLNNILFSISVAPRETVDIVLLPGGTVAMCGPEGVLVADPVSVVTFSTPEAKRLQATLKRRRDAVTLVHTRDGICSFSGIPDALPPQSVTIVRNAIRLPKLPDRTYPVAVQWGFGGATAWSLGAAPAVVALAVQATAIQVVEGEAAISSELWAAANSAMRIDLIVPGLTGLANDVLAGAISDELRSKIIRYYAAYSNGLAADVADALGALPSWFQPDASRWPGDPPGAWRNGTSLLHGTVAEYALFGISDLTTAERVISALRATFPNCGASLFLETAMGGRCAPVALESAAVEFLVRRACVSGAVGVIVPCGDAGPADLYSAAHGLAFRSGTTATVAAPCWGFCHRISSGGAEQGNAGWFGMGVGLDELGIIAAEEPPVA